MTDKNSQILGDAASPALLFSRLFPFIKAQSCDTDVTLNFSWNQWVFSISPNQALYLKTLTETNQQHNSNSSTAAPNTTPISNIFWSQGPDLGDFSVVQVSENQGWSLPHNKALHCARLPQELWRAICGLQVKLWTFYLQCSFFALLL